MLRPRTYAEWLVTPWETIFEECGWPAELRLSPEDWDFLATRMHPACVFHGAGHTTSYFTCLGVCVSTIRPPRPTTGMVVDCSAESIVLPAARRRRLFED